MRGGILSQTAFLAALFAAATVSAVPAISREMVLEAPIQEDFERGQLKKVGTGAEVEMLRRVTRSSGVGMEAEREEQRGILEKEQWRRKEWVEKFSTMSAPRVFYNKSSDRGNSNGTANAGLRLRLGMGMVGDGGSGWMGIGLWEVGLMMGVGLFL